MGVTGPLSIEATDKAITEGLGGVVVAPKKTSIWVFRGTVTENTQSPALA